MSSSSGVKLVVTIDLDIGPHDPAAVAEMLENLGKQLRNLKRQVPEWVDIRDSTPVAGPPAPGTEARMGGMLLDEQGREVLNFSVGRVLVAGMQPDSDAEIAAAFGGEFSGDELRRLDTNGEVHERAN